MTPQDPNEPNSGEPSFVETMRWPLIVVALLGGHLTLMLLGAAWAIAGADSYASPAGYSDSVSWDAKQAERRASEALGWQLHITPSVVTELNGDRRVVFDLTDHQGKPVADASLHVRLYHSAQASRVVETTVRATTPGFYEAKLPMRRPGAWDVQATAVRGDERFVVESEIWIAPVKRDSP